MNKKSLWMAIAMAPCLPVLAQAQAGPADSKSPAPAARYESAFADYKPWKDVSAGDWRAANQAVSAGAASGAHGGRAEPAAPPAASAASAARKPATPASATGHEGHHPQGGQK